MGKVEGDKNNGDYNASKHYRFSKEGTNGR